jgi:Mg-chelatase subunit ChlI
MDFKVLDSQGEWKEFLGQPSVDFSVAIHGMPGQGKSTFARKFAQYLA